MLGKKHSLIVLLAIGMICILVLATGNKILGFAGNGPKSFVKAVVVSADIEISNTFGTQRGQNAQVRLTSGPDNGKIVGIYNNRMSTKPRDTDIVLAPGDRIFLKTNLENGVLKYYFADFNRIPYSAIFLAVFIISLVYFGRIIGLKSLIGLGLSLLLLWQGFIAYTIKPGFNVYILAVAFCAVISLFVLLVVNGISVKTYAAVLGTWGGLAFASILSYLAIYFMHLTGFETEEAFLLKANVLPFVDFRGVLFAGVIIGALGAIIDVTVSIASAQFEIYQSSPEISWRELYQRGMNVGKDIMGAMSMTLVLAYVGSSLPLLLMIAVIKQVDLEVILNVPIVTTELVRAIVGSIGLIYAIPLTALIMAVFLHYKKVLVSEAGKRNTLTQVPERTLTNDE